MGCEVGVLGLCCLADGAETLVSGERGELVGVD